MGVVGVVRKTILCRLSVEFDCCCERRKLSNDKNYNISNITVIFTAKLYEKAMVMESEWTPVASFCNRAHCIFNYNVPPEPGTIYKLSLVLGDQVVILKEKENWYYGHTLANEAHKGLFPKAFVKLRNPEADDEPLVDEINSCLKGITFLEYYRVWKFDDFS